MRKILMLAAMLAAVGIAPQPAEAGDRGFGFRHFSGHAGAKFHRPHHGLKFHRRGLFGKHRQFEPRHFGHFGHRGFVLKFGVGDLRFRFGHVPRFERHLFGHRHGHGGLILRFGQPRHLAPWHHRGFAFRMHRRDAPQRFDRFEHGFPGFQHAPRGLHGGVPPEAILRRLEELGFRHVPTLLRERRH
jgi:hypothetical protein